VPTGCGGAALEAHRARAPVTVLTRVDGHRGRRCGRTGASLASASSTRSSLVITTTGLRQPESCTTTSFAFEPASRGAPESIECTRNTLSTLAATTCAPCAIDASRTRGSLAPAARAALRRGHQRDELLSRARPPQSPPPRDAPTHRGCEPTSAERAARRLSPRGEQAVTHPRGRRGPTRPTNVRPGLVSATASAVRAVVPTEASASGGHQSSATSRPHRLDELSGAGGDFAGTSNTAVGEAPRYSENDRVAGVPVAARLRVEARTHPPGALTHLRPGIQGLRTRGSCCARRPRMMTDASCSSPHGCGRSCQISNRVARSRNGRPDPDHIGFGIHTVNGLAGSRRLPGRNPR